MKLSALLRPVLAAATIGIVVLQADCATIQFDYSLDSGFFAAGSQARAALVAAGSTVESLLLDELDPIIPFGSNTWSATFTHPSTGDFTSVSGLIVPEDTVLIFVGARDLAGATIGSAGPGGYAVSGTATWVSQVESRGQGTTLGVSADDFGPWGGSLAIDNAVTWNNDHTQTPESGENDLYSVILHELGHILGVGAADSWSRLADSENDVFNGVQSMAAYGSAIPLTANNAHWQNGVSSTIIGTDTVQEAAFDPTILTGTRKLLTNLDVASLDDIGWEVSVPEPRGVWMLQFALPLFFCRRRRSQAGRD